VLIGKFNIAREAWEALLLAELAERISFALTLQSRGQPKATLLVPSALRTPAAPHFERWATVSPVEQCLLLAESAGPDRLQIAVIEGGRPGAGAGAEVAADDRLRSPSAQSGAVQSD
jgi:hypothetical protein